MKNLNYIKKALLLMTFITTFSFVASCNDNPRDTKAVAEERNKERFDNSNQRDDAQFLVNASEINLELIQLAQLAQQRGNSREVKAFGKKVEETHTKSQKELTELARNKNISIPSSLTDDSKDVHRNLNEKSRDDFDQEYINKMVSKHNDAINTFESAANDSHDRDVKNWARTSLTHLRSNREQSIESQKKFADMYFEGVLDASFNQIRQFSKGIPAVIIRLMEAMITILNFTKKESYKKAVIKHAEMILRTGKETINEKNDIDDLIRRAEKILN